MALPGSPFAHCHLLHGASPSAMQHVATIRARDVR
jgi:hypothetical protein